MSNHQNLNQKATPAADLQQTQQRLWVREQEINALKVQNRHLLTKLEQAEASAKPNQINTQSVADEVQRNLKPVLAEIEKSLKNAFDLLQSTMRGIYQQSSRAQQAVEDMTRHTRDIQNHMQENVATSMGTFCDRLERQILSRLNGIETMVQKQNEMLMDIETMKVAFQGMQKNSESNRAEVSRIEKESIEANQKLIEVQMQARNTEEVTRDALQQIRNHRSEFKLLRGEMRAILKNTNEVESADASNEDLTVVLERLQAQKSDLKKVAKDAENFLRSASEAESESDEEHRLENEEIHVTDLNASDQLSQAEPEVHDSVEQTQLMR